MKTHNHIFCVALCIVSGLLLLVCGCRKIEDESESWREFFEETRDMARRDAHEALATEINEFLREAEGDAGEELRANADFFRERIKMKLFGGSDAANLAKVTPRVIDRHKSLTNQPELTFYGWDLSQKDVQAFHYLSEEEPKDVSQAVTVNGPYSGTVDLTKVNPTPSSEYLELRIAEQGSIFINVIQPPRYKVTLTGTINGKDWTGLVGIGKSKWTRKTFKKNGDYDALELRDRFPFHYDELKYGGELRIEVDVYIQQQDNDNALKVDGQCRMYEGVTEESKDRVDVAWKYRKDLEKPNFNFTVALDSRTSYPVKLENVRHGKKDIAIIDMEVSFSSIKRETTHRSSSVILSGKLSD